MVSKLTRKEILELYTGLRNVATLKGARFSYAVIKNYRKLTPIVVNFEFSDSYKEYEKKRNTISAEAPTPDGSQYKRIEELAKEYENTIKETEKYLSEEIEIDLHQIPLVVVPENIDARLFEPILPIVEEELDK